MARSMDLLQKVIMKPEWKDLTSGILHEQDITRKTQESVVAVANAIVVPLSLLIHAAGLPSDDIEQLKLVWKQALGMLGEKSVEKQSKGIQAARSDLTLKDLEELAKFDREVAQGLDDGQITPITKADVQLMKLKNKKVVQRAAFDFGDGDDDVEETPTDEAPEQSAPIIIEDSESVANVPKNTVVFTSTDQESSSDESSTEKDSNEKFNTAINEESSDLPEMRRLNEVSKLEKEGLSSKQILSKSVAKKGLTLLPNPCFRIKARKTRTKIQKVNQQLEMTKTTLFRKKSQFHLHQKVKLKKIPTNKLKNNRVTIKPLETTGLQRMTRYNKNVSWGHTMKVTTHLCPKFQDGHQK